MKNGGSGESPSLWVSRWKGWKIKQNNIKKSKLSSKGQHATVWPQNLHSMDIVYLLKQYIFKSNRNDSFKYNFLCFCVSLYQSLSSYWAFVDWCGKSSGRMKKTFCAITINIFEAWPAQAAHVQELGLFPKSQRKQWTEGGLRVSKLNLHLAWY